jgi:hypothetical protein
MTEPSGKPTVALWIVVVLTTVVVLLAYPLSFGPACWTAGYIHTLDGPFCTIYRPLLMGLQHCPQTIRNSARWYFELWLPSGVQFTGEPDGGWFHDDS